ncbi:hypothetical protein FSO04_24230 [Paraburkholderia madseniana]|uniref:Uncharacterized protein n=1 Tax=Paraburkholderia madseniana TaxID=2599607 RepID=A0A6N6W9L2_9BURK|nr:hypothetical protein [Paraburkholderia madseniana]KAE8757332.1 hypothetical protein FSO04_24230 [Paraburkholderia madseniana]
MTTTTPAPARDSSAPKRDIRYLTIEPGRISLHGIALTDGEIAVLRGIAERMKGVRTVREQLWLPCPICKGIEGCDHTVPERERAVQEAAC